MAITEQEFFPGDVDTAEKKEKKGKKIRKLSRELDEALKKGAKGKKKRKKLERKLEKANMKLSLYESVAEERELRHQIELQNAKLEAALQMIVKGHEKKALPEVVMQYDG